MGRAALYEEQELNIACRCAAPSSVGGHARTAGTPPRTKDDSENDNRHAVPVTVPRIQNREHRKQESGCGREHRHSRGVRWTARGEYARKRHRDPREQRAD